MNYRKEDVSLAKETRGRFGTGAFAKYKRMGAFSAWCR
jgi:hypothetical protein